MSNRARRNLSVRLVVAVSLMMSACGGATTVDGDDIKSPRGLYASTCDASATIEFRADGIAQVNQNYCEGYGQQTMHYEIDGDVLRLAPEGRLDDPSSASDEFILSDGMLTLTGDSAFISCGNCQAGDTWEQQ